MVVKNLQNLVLRGSAVLVVGKAGNLRRGLGSTTNPETPEICISMRHPSHNEKQEFQPPASRLGHADYYRMDSMAAYGAGRSLRCAGVLIPTAGSTRLATLRRSAAKRTGTSPWQGV